MEFFHARLCLFDFKAVRRNAKRLQPDSQNIFLVLDFRRLILRGLDPLEIDKFFDCLFFQFSFIHSTTPLQIVLRLLRQLYQIKDCM